ncbi:hypothetical protein ANCDUO_04216 [Ancylostoma duodenale]|uniref:long-chain-fatty-acid--CoA ligase n=1 Tax=Ancylostoma duodenale TaxID=51022 RepID=A0A0C2H1P5_9BILA|nr:hypothetical protein ANCDUO_04216 [Ancylostoma duodenale]
MSLKIKNDNTIQEESGNGHCAGTRGADGKYRFRKYSDILRDSQYIASALIGDLGLKPGDNIGIYSQNRPEWLVSALACVQQSIVVVPLYDTLGPEAAAFIVSQADISVIIVDTVAKARNLVSKKTAMPTLKTVVMVDKNDVTADVVEEVGHYCSLKICKQKHGMSSNLYKNNIQQP